MAARWWADQQRPISALELDVLAHRPALLAELLRRFAVRLLVAGDHAPLRRALDTIGAPATATDLWLAVTSALTHLEEGRLPAAQDDLRHARQCWPDQEAPDLAVLRAATEHLGAVLSGQAPPGLLDEIAVDLTVSVNTVRSHVRSIYTKLGVGSRRTAVRTAHENGLLTCPVGE